MSDEEVVCRPSTLENYDLNFHVASIFIVLLLSSFGVFGTYLASRFPQLHVPAFVITLLQHFGTGVILATGLVHMLPGAIELLSNPCAGQFNVVYGTWASLFMLMMLLFMQALDYLSGAVMRRQYRKFAMGSELSSLTVKCNTPKNAVEAPAGCGDLEIGCASSASSSNNAKRNSLREMKPHAHAHSNPTYLLLDTPEARLRRRRLTTYILEAGIASHSVLIGVALGLTTGSSFKVLLIAICFHQFFEGAALGSRIAEVTSSENTLRALALAAAFAITTPIGIAITVGIQTSYSNSPASLISQGILDAIAAGILVYAALVQMLTEEVTKNAEFWSMTTARKVSCFVAVWLGAASMSVVGIWA